MHPKKLLENEDRNKIRTHLDGFSVRRWPDQPITATVVKKPKSRPIIFLFEHFCAKILQEYHIMYAENTIKIDYERNGSIYIRLFPGGVHSVIGNDLFITSGV